ncbi:MAG: polysaccharide export protein [Candidatus Margulisbacteria bacterium]|nr:polysaccharide export protein [Candidatus Margulisiibacteriota bacterium]
MIKNKTFIAFIFLSVYLAGIVNVCFAAGTSGIKPINTSDSISTRAAPNFILEKEITPADYMLGPGDKLDLHIILSEGDAVVDQSFVIGADGNVFFPKVGAIFLSGLSLSQAKDLLRKKIGSIYDDKFVLYLLLAEPKKIKVYLTGMVENPGPVVVYDHMRVSEVISQAGGVVSGGSNRYVFVKRKDQNGVYVTKRYDLYRAFRNEDITQDFAVLAGDVIEIPDADGNLLSQIDGNVEDKQLLRGRETFVYVYGDVNSSGRFEFVPGKTVADYVSYAGGPVQSANLSGTTVTRRIDNRSSKYRINLSDVLYNGKAEKDMEVMGGDVISVPRNFFYFSDFSSFASMVLTAVGLYNTFWK